MLVILGIKRESMASGGRTRVVVLGAGVIGMAAAWHLMERLGDRVEVTVVAEHFSPNTTADKAGSLIMPFDVSPKGSVGGASRVQRWAKGTFDLMHQLYRSVEASELELCLCSGYDIKSPDTPEPWWKDLVFGFRIVERSSAEAKLVHAPPSCSHLWAFTTFMLDCRKYLPWLKRKILQSGGIFEQRKIENLTELSDYDIIINCAGLGCNKLLGDQSVVPVRGQAVQVRVPWLRHFVVDYRSKDHLTYILPRANDTLLGGTALLGNWSERQEPETARSIQQQCQAFIPGLAEAEVIGGWVGLRPLRDEVRLELEQRGSLPAVVHCYGHGGQGVVLHWGCALEIGELVEQHLVGARARL